MLLISRNGDCSNLVIDFLVIKHFQVFPGQHIIVPIPTSKSSDEYIPLPSSPSAKMSQASAFSEYSFPDNCSGLFPLSSMHELGFFSHTSLNNKASRTCSSSKKWIWRCWAVVLETWIDCKWNSSWPDRCGRHWLLDEVFESQSETSNGIRWHCDRNIVDYSKLYDVWSWFDASVSTGKRSRSLWNGR